MPLLVLNRKLNLNPDEKLQGIGRLGQVFTSTMAKYLGFAQYFVVFCFLLRNPELSVVPAIIRVTRINSLEILRGPGTPSGVAGVQGNYLQFHGVWPDNGFLPGEASPGYRYLSGPNEEHLID